MAWAELKGITLGDESRDSADYTVWIERLKNFVTAFPQSANVAAANTQIKALEDEKKRVDAGEIKLEGKWLSKEELEEERVQVEGKLLLRRMQKQGAAGDLIEALNTFDVMEKRANTSASFPDAVVVARQAVSLLRPMVEKRKLELKEQVLENKRRIANVRGVDKSTLESAQKLTAKRVEDLVATYEERGAKWMPLNPATERSMNNLGSKLASEASLLNSRYNVEKMKEGLAVIEKIKALLKEEKYEEVEDLYSKAYLLWPQNEYAKRLQPVMAEVKGKAGTARIAADKAAAAKLLGGNPPPKPATGGTPGTTVATTKQPGSAQAADEGGTKEDVSPLSKPIVWVMILAVLGGGLFFFFKGKKAKHSDGDVTDI
jgi:hypothetical protein